LIAFFQSIHSSFAGVPSCVNENLLTRTLRDKMGFDGFVVSDCGAIGNLVTESRWSPNISAAVAESITAGNDVNCGPDYALIPSVVEEGLLSESDVDRALARTLTIRFRLGVFDPPEDSPFAHINMSVVGSPEHMELAAEAARQGIVLLKNQGMALPLIAGALTSVAVIGPQCDDELVLLGNYHGSPTHVPITPLAALTEALGKDKVRSSLGCWVQGEGTWRFGDAVQLAATSDVAVVFVGSSSKGTNISQPNLIAPATEKESLDRSSLLLPGVQLDLVKAIAKRTTTPIIVVLINGGAIDVEWMVKSNRVSAIVEAWCALHRSVLHPPSFSFASIILLVSGILAKKAAQLSPMYCWAMSTPVDAFQ
jgi:hypothetical protein